MNIIKSIKEAFFGVSYTYTVDMGMSHFRKYLMLTLYQSLYLSEGWYEGWRCNPKTSYGLYCKAKAMVLFDRYLNGEFERIESRCHEI